MKSEAFVWDGHLYNRDGSDCLKIYTRIYKWVWSPWLGCSCRWQSWLLLSAWSRSCGSAGVCCPVPGSWCWQCCVLAHYWTTVWSLAVFQCIFKGPPLLTLLEIAPFCWTTLQVFRWVCCPFFSIHAQFCITRIQSISSALESYLSTYKYYLMVHEDRERLCRKKYSRR